MKLSAHLTLAMLNRYLNVHAEASHRAADVLDRYRRDATGEGFGETATKAIN